MRRQKSCPARKAAVVNLLTCLLAAAAATLPAQAQTFKVLHTFHGKDGALPWTQLTRDAAGNLYGTTEETNGRCFNYFNYGCGAVFKLTPKGNETLLHSFNGKNGAIPMAGLLRDAAGNLYGTTLLGGDTNCYTYGCGTVFKLDRMGKETLLYKFTSDSDGEEPEAFLVADPTGNLYGTTYRGGEYEWGTVFKMDQAGKKTILHNFAGPIGGGGDGALSYEGVIRDSAGNLYGVTDAGGAYGAGVVYEVDTTGTETLLYSFSGGSDGSGPDSVLLADSARNLYGTTGYGGNQIYICGDYEGCGVVFKLSPNSNGSWTETVLYKFCSQSNCTDGNRPGVGPLVMDAAGNLYGTTYFGGGTHGCNGGDCGVVYKLDTAGNETVLHTFTGGADGAAPPAGVIIDGAGNLYGTAELGGDSKCAADKQGCGVVFKLTP